jgi:hypothetical protein
MGLIVHIKLNGGVILEDTAAGRPTRDRSLERTLARFLHGQWDEDDWLAPPTTFEQHLNRTTNFHADREYTMTHFLKHLRETKHVHSPQVQAMYTQVSNRLGASRLFDSAANLFALALNNKPGSPDQVHIVLRSFGSDLPWVCHETGLPWVFAHFVRGTLYPDEGSAPSGSGTPSLADGLTTPEEMNDFFAQHPFVAIQDEYPRWVAHTFSPLYGMPFPADARRLNESVFFTTTKKSSSVTPIGDGRHTILGLNTLKAIDDPRYFVRKLELHLLFPPNTPNPLYVSQ